MFTDPTFWVAVAFILFFLLLAYFKVPGLITKQLDARADKIRSDLDEAEKLREEAQELLATYQKKQRDAAKEAEGIISAAKEEAERMVTHGRERLDAVIERREKQAKDRIAQAEAAALTEVRQLTVDVALEATRDVLQSKLSDAKADQLIDDAIADLDRKLH